MTKEDFKEWYVQTLETLYPHRWVGFPIVIISLALLERYIRRRSKTHEKDNLGDNAMGVISEVFPVLKGEERNFWHIYRNGLLHQVTFMGGQISQ